MALSDITFTGTATQFTTDPTNQGATVETRGYATADLDGVSGAKSDHAFWQEVSLFIGKVSVAQGVDPLSCLTRVRQICTQMLAFPNVGA